MIDRERYRWEREGLHWVVRAGTGTRVLFRCWRERTAMRVSTELLTAYLDGHFQALSNADFPVREEASARGSES